MAEEEKYYTPEEVAERLKINPRFIKDKANNGLWPCYKFGRDMIRFTEDDIQQIKDLHRRTPEARNTRTNRRQRINQLIA